VFFLRKKSDLLSEYKKWLTKAQLHTATNIKSVRSEKGGEYVSNAFTVLHDEYGTEHHTTVRNGVAERLNRGLVQMERTRMGYKDVDQDR